MEGLTAGRIVHFVVPNTPEPHPHRPAIVTRVWNDAGMVQLQVFTDGTNDGEWGKPNVVWETSVAYSEEPTPRTWHWIERA